MPDILVLADMRTAWALAEQFDAIGTILRGATAAAIPDLERDPVKVAAMLIPFIAGSNAPRVQVVGMASYSEARANVIKTWREHLRDAWLTSMAMPEIESISGLPKPDEVEVWPTMPLGSWCRVSDPPD